MLKLEASPLLIAGPSGIGKTFFADLLFKHYPDVFGWLLSTSDRPRRDSDVVGRDYDIVDTAEYQSIAASGDFFMDNHFFGYNYGYRRSDLARILDAGKVPLALVYTPVVHQFFERVAGTYGLFLEPADVELLKKGLRRRGEKPESIAKRLAGLEAEMAAFQKFRHRFDEVVLVKDDTSVLEACARVATRYRLNPILTLS